jgi:hypothetical protein
LTSSAPAATSAAPTTNPIANGARRRAASGSVEASSNPTATGVVVLHSHPPWSRNSTEKFHSSTPASTTASNPSVVARNRSRASTGPP